MGYEPDIIIESPVSIKSLIEEGNEMLQGIKYVPAPSGVIRMFSVYTLADDSKYERWKNVVIRYLSSNYPNDISVNDFRKASEEFEKGCYSPKGMRKMVAILESLEAIPTKIENTSNKQNKEPSVIINNTNSQSQSQVLNIDLFTKAIEDVLTVSQIKEMKKVVEEEGGDLIKAKPKLVEKLKSFGENLASNIVANLMTNPSIWASMFS